MKATGGRIGSSSRRTMGTRNSLHSAVLPLMMRAELVAIAVEDPRGPTILATIRQFNERLTRHPAAKDWNEVVRRVGDPLNTDLFR